MDSYRILKEKIENKTAKICVIGLGYVGLPLAVSFAKAGYFVYGFDKNSSRIDKLKKGERYIVDVSPGQVKALINKKKFIPALGADVLSKSDVIIICVPTPLRKVKIPDISYVVDAAKTIRKYLKGQQLVILESTSPPTTTGKVVLPILEKSGLKPEEDFFLCFSPERINPGDKKFMVTKITKIVGGLSQKSTGLAKSLYKKIIKKIFVVSFPEVAETVKLLENTFRLVNIALANEFAIVCNRLGISV
jgi:UDP-N-acetyl-D-glucosamine dehydrogenase